MSMNEAGYIIKNREEEYINSWNQTRFIAYSIIQSQSSKAIKVTDVLKFPWDKKSDENLVTKSREELLKHAAEIEKKLNNING
jgi:hypothetical protein